jgi:hypothetical protein
MANTGREWGMAVSVKKADAGIGLAWRAWPGLFFDQAVIDKGAGA